MKFLSIVFLFLLANRCFSQGFTTYNDGRPARLQKVVDIKGTEFMFDRWVSSKVVFLNESFENVDVKYSLVDDKLYFLGKDSVVMDFVKPVKGFSLKDESAKLRVFKNGFSKNGNFNEASFYEVLADGKAVFLKKESKKINESREYNSATTTKEFVSNQKYFVFTESNISEIKKDKSFFLTLFADQKTALENYLSSQKINFRKEDDIIKIVTYYNSLK